MSGDVSEFGITHSGAIDDDWHERHDSGYIAGGASAMADRILSETAQGRDGADGDKWDMSRDTADLKDGEVKGPGTRGLRPGYGDPRLS